MSSRLFTEIREKRGLCYYVRAEDDYYHDVGVFSGRAGVDLKRVNEAVEAMKQEFMALRDKKPVTQAELEMAQQNSIGQLLLELEDSQSVAGWYGMKQLLLGEIESEEEVIKKLEAVKLSQVQELVEEYVKEEELRFAIIGPFQESDITAL